MKWNATRAGCALALAALSSLAWADTASVSISKLKVEIVDLVPGDSVWPWAVFFSGDPSWMSFTTLAGAHLESPSADQVNMGWLGSAQAAMLSTGSSQAQSGTTAGDLWSAAGPGAWALVNAVDGQQGWAYATLFNGRFLAGAETGFVVTATVDAIAATGTDAQANASIELCTSDGACEAAGYSEALAFAGQNFAAPTTLRAAWSNASSDSAWGTMNVGVAAAATSQASPVPEPVTGSMLLAGLLTMSAAAAARRRRR